MIDFVARMTFFRFSLNCVGSPLFGRQLDALLAGEVGKVGRTGERDKETPAWHLAAANRLLFVRRFRTELAQWQHGGEVNSSHLPPSLHERRYWQRFPVDCRAAVSEALDLSWISKWPSASGLLARHTFGNCPGVQSWKPGVVDGLS